MYVYSHSWLSSPSLKASWVRTDKTWTQCPWNPILNQVHVKVHQLCGPPVMDQVRRHFLN